MHIALHYLNLDVGTNLSNQYFVAAPEFTAQAVVDGDFKTVSLSDYKGK